MATIDLSKATLGDRYITRDGSVATYVARTRQEEFSYVFNVETWASHIAYRANGTWAIDPAHISKLDLMAKI